MNNSNKKAALIYCRVSSERQKNEGHGLESQEHRCREYAKSKGYDVEQVFKDSYSGGGDFMHRPAMKDLLFYVDKRAHRNYVVIFDDLKRFARDTEFHIKLRAALRGRSIEPECLNYTFDDSPEGVFAETIFAAQGQLEREQNRRQVIQKQKARLEKGYWPFFPPPGYTQVKDPSHGRILKPIQPQARIIKEAFEGFASDRFFSQADVMKFLREAGYSKQPIYQEGVRRMLRRAVYAGYVERAEWDVARRKGQHEGIVSLEVFEKVQAKLDGKGRMPVRKSDKLDFVLRGFLLCAFCVRPMTASWSRGRSKRHRYYRCITHSCERRNKSIAADYVDREFKILLQSASPTAGAAALANAIVLGMWESKIKDFEGRQSQLEARLAETRKQVDVLVARIVKAMDEKVISAYEHQIAECRRESEVLQEKLKNLGATSISFETALEAVMAFLKNPLVIWEKEEINAKRLVMRLVFAEKLAFHPQFGFETAQKSLLVGLFEQMSANKTQDVEMARIERACNEVLLELLRSVDHFSFLKL